MTTVLRDVCGTRRGFYRHRYYNEQPCDDCRIEYNAYMRAYRASRLPYTPKRLLTQSSILDLLDMLGPMSMPQIVNEMELRNIGTLWSVRRAVYRLRDKGLVERVGSVLGGPFGTTVIAVWGLTERGEAW